MQHKDNKPAFGATTTLYGAIDSMSEQQQNLVGEMLQFYGEQFSKIVAAPPIDVAAAVHKSVDDAVQEYRAFSPKAAEIKCKKGCNACCRQRVSVWPQEAAILVEYAKDQGVTIDMERLKRQAAHHGDWLELDIPDQACVFIGPDGGCQVYEHRPTACRKYFVITDPALCDTVKNPGHKVGIWFSAHAEAIESAALTVFGDGDMANQLLRAIK